TKERAVTTGSSKRTNTPTKVIVAILLLAVIAGVLLFVQRDSSSSKTVKLTKRDMELVFQEMLPPQAQQMIASNPEEKKKLVEEVKKILAVAQLAESEGYAQRPEIEKQLAFQSEMSLNQAYRKKNPDMKVGEDQVNAYYQAIRMILTPSYNPTLGWPNRRRGPGATRSRNSTANSKWLPISLAKISSIKTILQSCRC
ncbi:MAG TPA: hypothetical protein VE732_05595, partial [Nitrososphaera sp.]|nr:hypothetical protein [Nitrososphaera sp.]